MMIYAGKKICAKNLLKEAAVALSVGKEWPDVAHKEELTLLQVSKNMAKARWCGKRSTRSWRTTGQS